MGIAEAAIEGIWGKIGQIEPTMEFWTPAERKSFNVATVQADGLTIATANNNPVRIPKQAFVSAIAHLVSGGHSAASPCEIRSNKSYDEAGPLCQATRSENGTMTITYVLPVLKEMGLVDIKPSIPTATWLLA